MVVVGCSELLSMVTLPDDMLAIVPEPTNWKQNIQITLNSTGLTSG